MDKKFLITCIILMTLALVIVPAMAPEPPISGSMKEINEIVRDIQTRVNTLITNLAAVQGDVTMIKSTTDMIENKLDTPPKPTRYEYYATWKSTYVATNYYVWWGVHNWGNYPANVTICPKMDCLQSWQLPGNTSDFHGGGEFGDFYYLKITTDSPLVEPSLIICKGGTNDVDTRFLPGDFLRVEIYS